MTTEKLSGEATEASGIFPNVKVTFNGAQTFVQEPPGLGEEIRFEVTGYVRKVGTEFIERDETERAFVQVQVTGVLEK